MEAAKGGAAMGRGSHGERRRREGEVAATKGKEGARGRLGFWGRVAPPPPMAGQHMGLWAKAQAQVVRPLQKTPSILLFNRFAKRKLLPIKYSLPIIYSLPVNSF